MDITRRILQASGGQAIAGIRRFEASSVAEAAAQFGLRASPDVYFEISAEEAHAVLVAVLHEDMAYGMERMPLDGARKLAAEFVAALGEGSARFYTNGEFGRPRKAPGAGPAWRPATDATFDTGVIAVSPTHIACAWLMDED